MPTQKETFLKCNKNQSKGGVSTQPKNVKINYISVKIEGEEQAQIYVALDPSGCNHQYTVLEAQGDYEGKSLTFLIDSRSSHSFISPRTAKRLRVEAHPTGKKLRASLANKSSISIDDQILDLSSWLGRNPTSQEFRILRMGKF